MKDKRMENANNRICPKCGKNSDEKEFFEAFCVDCYPFNVKLPKDLKLEVCKRCGRMRLRGEWQPYDRKKVEGWVASKCRGGYESCVYSLQSSVAGFRFRKDDKEITVKRDIELKTQDTVCQDCSRISGGYYEAIVQLRGDPRRVERKMAILSTELGRKGTFISKAEEMHGGMDLYIGSSKAVFETLQKLGLKASKISRKLAGRREGKKMYRTTFAVRV